MHKQTHDMHAHIVTYTCLNCVMCIIVLIGQYISGNLLLCKAEKPSVCLRHGIILVVYAWIDLRFGLCRTELFEM